MGNKFENILVEKVREDKELIALKHQWEYIKLYVPQKLRIISQVFPHYSLHDESHSINVLNNIWRIIGEKVALKFSVTDLWLLLSAAYLHDCGMIVLKDDFENCFSKEEDFKNYIKDCQKDIYSELHEESLLFEIKDNNKIYYKNIELKQNSFNAARYLIADFYRKQHASRSASFVRSDMVTTITTSIIDKRLKDLLALICESHTLPFDKVLELPHDQNSIYTENCHPRYIACLLRLGDLLDLDNNRFSKTLLESLGDSLPKSSNIHLGKHESFERVLFNTKEISIQSRCNKYDVAEEILALIALLKKELRNQKTNWSCIAPNKSYGYLPRLSYCKVSLNGFNKLVRQESKEFALNRSKVLELLQGSGIYNHPWQSIRELIQNSIDATLIRVWTKIKKNSKSELLNECGNLPIEISIDKSNETESNNENTWIIKLYDKGCGMNYNEIKHLIKALSSSDNKSRKSIIDEMPEWFKPSGVFGIGFQSVFLITDKVKIKTKSLDSNKVIELDIPKTKKGKNSLLTIKCYYDNKFEVGTELIFNLILEKIPTRFTINYENSYKTFFINSYDFIKDKSLDIKIAELIDEIYKLAFSVLIPIKLYFNQKEIKLNQNDKFNFEINTDICISNVYPCNYLSTPILYYRGQKIEKTDLIYYFLVIEANVLYGNAKEFLTINRNNLKEDKKDEIYLKCLLATYKYIKNTYNCKNFANEKLYYSMFVHFYKNRILALFDDIQRESEYNFINSCKDYEDMIIDKTKNISIKTLLLDSNQLEFKENNTNRTITYIMVNHNDKENYEIVVDLQLKYFILSIASDYGYRYLDYKANNNILIYKNNCNVIDNFEKRNIWKCKINYKQYLLDCFGNFYFKRFLIPCSEDFYLLSIETNKFNSSLPLSILSKQLFIDYPVMVSPLFLEKDKNGKSIFRLINSEEEKTDYIDFVVKNSDNKKDGIKVGECFNQLIKAFSEFIDELNEEIKQSPFDIFCG